MSTIRTIEQDRVAAALGHVGSIAESNLESYARQASTFGPLLLANGLAGALAFAGAKGNESFVAHLQEWVGGRPEFTGLPGDSLLAKLADVKCSPALYRQMTQEVLLYTNWLKRLAGARNKARNR